MFFVIISNILLIVPVIWIFNIYLKKGIKRNPLLLILYTFLLYPFISFQITNVVKKIGLIDSNGLEIISFIIALIINLIYLLFPLMMIYKRPFNHFPKNSMLFISFHLFILYPFIGIGLSLLVGRFQPLYGTSLFIVSIIILITIPFLFFIIFIHKKVLKRVNKWYSTMIILYPLVIYKLHEIAVHYGTSLNEEENNRRIQTGENLITNHVLEGPGSKLILYSDIIFVVVIGPVCLSVLFLLFINFKKR